MFKKLSYVLNLKRKIKFPLIFGTIGFSFLQYLQYEKQKQEKCNCCGIIGIVSQQENAEKVILRGIQLLQNRGYDSAGIASLKRGIKDFSITKIASSQMLKIDCIKQISQIAPQIHNNSYAGLGHTRWATCGIPSDENSHPHFDTQKRVALVHNGNLENFKQLREELQKNPKIQLYSMTDSELIAQCIGLYLEENSNMNLFQAVQETIKNKIKGDWALVIFDKKFPNKMIVARNKNPILIGIGNDSMFAASEKFAFIQYTNQYLELNDNEIIEMDVEKIQEFKNIYKQRIKQIEKKEEEYLLLVQPGPLGKYKYLYEQEMIEQSKYIECCLSARLGVEDIGDRYRLNIQESRTNLSGLDPHKEKISQIENCIIIACGSSLYGAQYVQYFFKKMRCFKQVVVIEGSEAIEYDFPPAKNSCIIAVSQSGETQDIIQILNYAKQKDYFIIGVVNVIGSALARLVDCGVYVYAGWEGSVASTKAFSCQVLCLIMIGIYISDLKEKKIQQQLQQPMLQQQQQQQQQIQILENNKSIWTKDLSNLEIRQQLLKDLQQISQVFEKNLIKNQAIAEEISKRICKQKKLLTIGKGPGLAIAKEGALKLKELTYIHTEAFPAGELKHGPQYMIPQLPVKQIQQQQQTQSQPKNNNQNPPMLNQKEDISLKKVDSNEVVQNKQIEQEEQATAFLCIFDDQYFNELIDTLEQLNLTNVDIIVITNCKQKILDSKVTVKSFVEVEDCGFLTPLGAVTFFQQLTLNTCILLGTNVDKPRNLAKTVTIRN